MCFVSATAILVAFLFTILIRYLFQGGKMKKIDWDMATVTAGDYSVELDIETEDYHKWKAESYEQI